MINDLREGQIVDGVVKRIKRYGAFIDLGGLDGLLHITNMSYKRLKSDPWERASSRYPLGGKVRGVVTGVTKYGAFVELESGIEGLAHVADMNWSKHFADLSEIVSNFQEVAVVVLQVDTDKRRIRLALCSDG